MQLTEEMEKMKHVIEANVDDLTKNNSVYKRYFAPEIPDKIMKNLIKNFDNHLPVHGVVAFIEEGLVTKGKTGVIFTYDGFYNRYLGKPFYVNYADVKSLTVLDSGNIAITTTDGTLDNEVMYTELDGYVFRRIFDSLKSIDAIYGQSVIKSSGKVKKLDIPKDMLTKCNATIHTASVACGGVGTGLAQIPASDNAVIVPIQITMIVALGVIFDLNITEGAAKSIIASAGATIAGRTVSQFLVGWIPGIGNAINTATAAGITEAIGWIAVKNFYERWIEDKAKGRLDGMKDGYVSASGEYERKLRKQAEEFLNQKKDYIKERDEYEKLLSEYERYIKDLEVKYAAMDLIDEMKDVYNNLISLQSA